MVEYEYYKNEFHGKISQPEYDDLEPGVCRLIDAYIKNYIPYWRVKRLSEYGINFDEVICMQIDFIAQNGGISALNGNSDFNVSSVSTSGFNFSLKGNRIPMLNNVPLAPLMVIELNTLLRQNGLLSRCMV